MGLAFSCAARRRVADVRRKWPSTFDALRLTDKQIWRLLTCFDGMDEDNNHTISRQEFFRGIDLERTLFSERAFRVIDQDDSGSLDFNEFVIAVYNYCTMRRDALVKFAFDLCESQGACASLEAPLAESQLRRLPVRLTDTTSRGTCDLWRGVARALPSTRRLEKPRVH